MEGTDQFRVLGIAAVHTESTLGLIQFVITQGNNKADNGEFQVADGLSNGGEHCWWYLGEQEPDEAVLFSGSDCRPGKLATGAVYGSCPLPDQADKPVRQSVEVRVIAVFRTMNAEKAAGTCISVLSIHEKFQFVALLNVCLFSSFHIAQAYPLIFLSPAYVKLAQGAGKTTAIESCIGSNDLGINSNVA